MARLIVQGATAEHPDLPVLVVPEEGAALAVALELAGPGDLIVASCEKPDDTAQVLAKYGGEPVPAISLAAAMRHAKAV